jgi:SAM-dependent MidA family methyltransferase
MSIEAERPAVTGSLSHIIEERIAQRGPMPFDEYMQIWNNGASDASGIYLPGFYDSPETVIGNYDRGDKSLSSDFSTSPESSPVFGSLIARQALEMWEAMDKDPDFRIVELGGGNGTLAYDIVYALRRLDPAMPIRYTIIEQSQILAGKQRERLADLGVEVVEGSALDSIPREIKGLVLSNELMDDLPTKILKRTDNGWDEIRIEDGGAETFIEKWGTASSEAINYANRYLSHIKTEEITPASISSDQLMQAVGRGLEKGFVLTIDYFRTSAQSPFYTVAAQSKSTIANSQTGKPDHLSKLNVGNVNITSEVDFQALAKSGSGAGLDVVGDVTLGGFLQELGYFGLVKQAAVSDKRELFGDRFFSYFKTENALRTSGFRVLIQSKGVNLDKPLAGSGRRFMDVTIGADEEYYRDNFIPVEL